jgi:putative ABC transport system substrate-binding protein
LARRPTIGYLAAISSAPVLRSANRRGFLSGLHEHGYDVSQNVDIAYRFADGDFQRLPAVAQELVGLKPDIILAPAEATALAAHGATTTIPIVCPLLDNPVRQGLAMSEARPGGNVTGILRYIDGFASKRLELAKELVPAVTTVGILIGPESASQRRDVETAGRVMSLEIVPVEVETSNEVDAAIGALMKAHVQALIVPADSLFFGVHGRINEQTVTAGLPAIWFTRETVVDGGLISYGVDESENFRRAAYYVDKILKGATPADLPIELPTKFEMVINLKTAKSLGLTISEAFLQRADEVIE